MESADRTRAAAPGGPRPASSLGRSDSATPAPGGASSAATDVVTPDDVVYAAELRRSRVFAAFVIGIATAASVAVAFQRGDPLAKRVLWTCAAICAFGSLVWIWHLSRAERYRSSYGFWFGLLNVIGITGGFYYFGPFSAVVMVIPLGAFMYSMGQSRADVIKLAVCVCASHGVLSGLIVFDVIEDRGRLVPRDPGLSSELTSLFLIQSIFIASFIMGRVVRRSTLALIERRDEALRQATQREALLHEARQELEHAIGVDHIGRYTDLTVGSYRLGPVIGRGAMGQVYEAVHVATGEPAAVKLLLPAALADPRLVRRFLREIELAASLDSPHVVRVLEVSGEDSPLEYIAMERLRGHSLAELLRESPRLAPDEVVEMTRQLAEGITAARAARIVHRDLKPRNVFCHRESEHRFTWKVLDFGVSKLMSHAGTLTEGHVVGTPSYMAPEQARGETVDFRADIYALAALTYRALTGRPAFAGADVAALLYAVVHQMPVRPSSAAPLRLEVDDVLAIGMAKDPNDRFDDAQTFAQALDGALRGSIDSHFAEHARILGRRYRWRDS